MLNNEKYRLFSCHNKNYNFGIFKSKTRIHENKVVINPNPQCFNSTGHKSFMNYYGSVKIRPLFRRQGNCAINVPN